MTFQQTYSAPPLVFVMPSYSAATPDLVSPSNVRVRNVTTTGFQLVQVAPFGDWNFLFNDFWSFSDDDDLAVMTVAYVAIDSGINTMPDGTVFEATSSSQSYYNSSCGWGCWNTISITIDQGPSPVVLATIQTMNSEIGTPPYTSSEPFLAPALTNLGKTSFSFALDSDNTFGLTYSEQVAFLRIKAPLNGHSFTDNSSNTIKYETFYENNVSGMWQNCSSTKNFTGGSYYGKETPAQGVILKAASLVAPAGGRNGTLNNGAIGNGSVFTANNGTLTGSTFYWDEVGAITLQASVASGSYLGTGNVQGSVSGTVGRFRPDHFAVALNTPILHSYCGTGTNGFVYQGQPFGYATGLTPVITTTAQNMQNTTTQNYANSWWRLSNASLTGIGYTAAMGTLNTLSNPWPAVTYSGDGVSVGIPAGTGYITFSSNTQLGFDRSSSTPSAAFNADIALATNVLDLDNVAYTNNPVQFGQATVGNGIGFDQSKRILYGRLKLKNTQGPQNQNLSLPVMVEYFDNTLANNGDFRINAADTCTQLLPQNFACAVSNTTLNTSATTNLSTLSSLNNMGSLTSGITFNASTTGYIDVTSDLSSAGMGGSLCPGVAGARSGANLTWLEYDWTGGGTGHAPTDNPTARVSFGLYSGGGKTIERMETR